MEPEQVPPQDEQATGGAPVATEEVPAGAPEVTTEPSPAAAPAATEIDWETRFTEHLQSLPPEKLYELHPKLRDDFQGRTGREAQRQAQQLAAQQAQEAYQRAYLQFQQDQAQKELDRLADEDPYAHAERWKQMRQQTQQQTATQREQMLAAMNHWRTVDENVILPMLNELPEPDQREVAARIQLDGDGLNYYARQTMANRGGMPDWIAARRLAVADMNERKRTQEVQKAQADLEKKYAADLKRLKELDAAREAEARGAEAETEGSPDLGGGSPGGGMPSMTQYLDGTAAQRKKWETEHPNLIHHFAAQAGKR